MANAIVIDELGILFKPLNDFLTALQQPDINTEAVAADAGKLLLAEIQNVPQIESVGIAGTAKDLQEKLQAVMTPLPSPTPTPAPAPGQ